MATRQFLPDLPYPAPPRQITAARSSALERLLSLRCVIALVSLLTVHAATAQQDTGLVSKLRGVVTYQTDITNAGRATPFMKIRSGDRFTVPAGTEVQLVYFSSARVEHWRGPAAFVTGTSQSAVISGQATVSVLPNTAPSGAELGRLLILGRSGSVTLRGPSIPPGTADADIAYATENAGRWRIVTASDDPLPDLYLYAVLKQYDRKVEMKSLVDLLMKKFPDNQEVRRLLVEDGEIGNK